MAKKIIFNGETGILSIMYPAPEFFASLPSDWTEEEKLIHLADKDLPTGTGYEIVDDDFSVDREFRNAWEYTAGSDEKKSAELSNEYKRKYNMEITE